MYAGIDFDPSDTGEDEIYQFDYTAILASGETIVSAVWTCAVVNGTDGSPASHLQGAPLINSAGTATQQWIQTLIPGVQYRLQAMVTTSIGQKLSLYSHVLCTNPA
jgi:hypothetical protein